MHQVVLGTACSTSGLHRGYLLGRNVLKFESHNYTLLHNTSCEHERLELSFMLVQYVVAIVPMENVNKMLYQF